MLLVEDVMSRDKPIPMEQVRAETIVKEIWCRHYRRDARRVYRRRANLEVVVMETAEPIEEETCDGSEKKKNLIVKISWSVEEIISKKHGMIEEVVADEPAPTAEIAKQEEAIEEPTQEQPSSDVEVDLDIKVADYREGNTSKIQNEMQRVSVKLDVINEWLSREITQLSS